MISFPPNPSTGDEFTAPGGITWIFNDPLWVLAGDPDGPPTGLLPYCTIGANTLTTVVKNASVLNGVVASWSTSGVRTNAPQFFEYLPGATTAEGRLRIQPGTYVHHLIYEYTAFTAQTPMPWGSFMLVNARNVPVGGTIANNQGGSQITSRASLLDSGGQRDWWSGPLNITAGRDLFIVAADAATTIATTYNLNCRYQIFRVGD